MFSYLGVTPPISTAESNDREKEVTETLIDELRRQNAFEPEEDSRTRYVNSPVHYVFLSEPCVNQMRHTRISR